MDPRSLVHRPCQFDPDLFTSEDRYDIRRAKSICNGCPETSTCLAHGLKIDELVDHVARVKTLHGAEGIYGGLTRTGRLKIRKA